MTLIESSMMIDCQKSSLSSAIVIAAFLCLLFVFCNDWVHGYKLFRAAVVELEVNFYMLQSWCGDEIPGAKGYSEPSISSEKYVKDILFVWYASHCFTLLSSQCH